MQIFDKKIQFGSIHGVYNLACGVTMIGAFAGCLSIYFAISGMLGFAMVALMIAGVADLFDGYVARKLNLGKFEKEYGVQLDTVVDVLSFVAAPAVIGLTVAGSNLLIVICVVAFMLTGLVRLAHFNTFTVKGEMKPDTHSGLPVTYAALVLPLIFIASDTVGETLFRFILGAVFLLLAVLFVVPINVPKPRGVFYVIFPLLAASMIVFWINHEL